MISGRSLPSGSTSDRWGVRTPELGQSGSGTSSVGGDVVGRLATPKARAIIASRGIPQASDRHHPEYTNVVGEVAGEG